MFHRRSTALCSLCTCTYFIKLMEWNETHRMFYWNFWDFNRVILMFEIFLSLLELHSLCVLLMHFCLLSIYFRVFVDSNKKVDKNGNRKLKWLDTWSSFFLFKGNSNFHIFKERTNGGMVIYEQSQKQFKSIWPLYPSISTWKVFIRSLMLIRYYSILNHLLSFKNIRLVSFINWTVCIKYDAFNYT